MQRTFFINLFLLVFINLLIKPFWILGVNVGVQNAVGPESYGVFFALLNFSYLFQLLLDLGMQSYNYREVARNPKSYQSNFAHLALLKAAFSLLFIFVVYAGGKFFMYYNDSYLELLLWIGLSLILNSFLLFLRSNLGGLQLFKWDSVASVLDKIFMILIVGTLLWGGITEKPFEIIWFAWAQVAAFALACVFLFFVLVAHSGLPAFHFEKKLLWSLLKKGSPYALLTLLMTAYNRLDGVMLEKLLADGALQAGIYAQAFKFFEAANMMAFLVAGLLLPLFSRMLSKKEDVLPILFWVNRFLLVPAVLLSFLVAAYSEHITLFLFKEQTENTTQVLALLMLSFIPVSVGYIYGTLLTANGYLRLLNGIALLGLALNIALNISLIPMLKAEGAAWATLCTQWIVVLGQFIYAKIKFKIQMPINLIIRISLWLILVLLMAAFSTLSALPWPLALILFFVAGLILSFAFGLFSLKDFKAALVLKD